MRMFAHFGFVECLSGSFEAGKVKLAIFANDYCFTHVARQLESGRWSSKLGEEMDLEHDLAALEGPLYGRVVKFMERSS